MSTLEMNISLTNIIIPYITINVLNFSFHYLFNSKI